ncbi:MAG TPA: universal stress protein [Longimicrobiales bacterium]
MFRRVMVPLDGSPFGEQALPAALWVARRSTAQLQLVHVRAAIPEIVEKRGRGWVDRASNYLETTAQRVSEELGAPVAAEVLEDHLSEVLFSTRPRKAIAEALQAYAAEHGVDLIVMTTHGRGGLDRAWLGSVADSLIRQASVPLLLIRPDSKKAGTEPAEFRVEHILLPLDGSARGELILDHALRLGRLDGARYTLFHAVSTPIAVDTGFVAPAAYLDTVIMEERKRQAEEYLAGVAERLKSESLAVDIAVVVDSNPAGAIRAFAAEAGVDLIAMGTRGFGGSKRLLLGSVTDKVIRTADRPLLVYNTGAEGTNGRGGRLDER